jgi:Flp pilus assembly protein TadD
MTLHPSVLFLALAALAALAFPVPPARSAPGEPVVHEWAAVATDGRAVKVPAATAATVLAFVRPEQAQSKSALDQIHRVVGGAKDISCVVVISGERGTREAQAISTAVAWPVVLDPDFRASGKFNVHVWPTTVVVKPNGQASAHLPGLSDSFAADLEDHLAHAAGVIDATTLKQRLAEHEVVGDGNAAKADRQLALAIQFVESGRLGEAAAMLDQALKQRPGDARPAALMARVHLLQNQPERALELLDQLPADALPPFQLNLLRARALIALQRWDEARRVVPETLKLNPSPAESHYLIGLIAQHDGKAQEAAESFRRAYELSAGRAP